ncbi:MAG: 4-hydroxy-tetrahydrodipicolinate reductase, partial [Firmicutes bacterium]|nr:4-hydroxy-tetrahydrodipicolinate reductase [Bacillota bacterium]
MEKIRVAVAGAAGRMGREVVKAVTSQEDMLLVAAVDPAKVGEDAGTVAGIGPLGVTIEPILAEALARSDAQVMVDFTVPEVVLKHLRLAITAGVAAVVGTTGINAEGLASLSRLAAAGALVRIYAVPSFSGPAEGVEVAST